MRVCSSQTVEALKRQVENKAGVAVREQRLVCASRQLECSKTLEESGVRAESTVHLLLRLRGGALPKSFDFEKECAEPQGAPIVFAPVGRTDKVRRWSLQEACAIAQSGVVARLGRVGASASDSVFVCSRRAFATSC